MTDYKKLVKALRRCASIDLCDGMCEMNYGSTDCESRLEIDAADAIEKLVALYEKAEMDATNLTGKLAQAEADMERLNLEIDKRIATEIELSNQVDALQAEVERLKDCNEELREKQTYIDHYGDKWMTSAKDVPTAAYKHGYEDGRDEAEAQLPKRGEIVRCKECIHFTQGGWCDREFDWFPVDENDFCSMAEKMEVQDERTDKA